MYAGGLYYDHGHVASRRLKSRKLQVKLSHEVVTVDFQVVLVPNQSRKVTLRSTMSTNQCAVMPCGRRVKAGRPMVRIWVAGVISER